MLLRKIKQKKRRIRKADFTAKVTFEQRHERDEGESHVEGGCRIPRERDLSTEAGGGGEPGMFTTLAWALFLGLV